MTALLLSLGFGGVALTVIGGLCMRGRGPFIERHRFMAIACVVVAMSSGGFFYMAAFESVLDVLPRDLIVAGAFFGLAFGALPVAIGAPVLLLLFLADPEFRLRVQDPALSAWMGLAALAGCVVSGILLLQVFSLIRGSAVLAIVLVPVAVGLFPFIQQLFRAPALLVGLRRRQQQLEPACAGELRAWADALAATYRLGEIEVLFGPAKVANAAAVGFRPFTRFIMMGDGLTAEMPPRELRAILTHEIAHILRNDVRNQALLAIGLGTAWVYLWAAVSMAAGLRGPMWALTSAAGWMAVLILTGIYSRRCELAADRLAAELMEAPDEMRDALTRLGSLTPLPTSHRSHTHPSLDERLASLSALPRASLGHTR